VPSQKPHIPLKARKHPAHHSFVERFNELAIVLLTVCTKDRKRILAKAAACETLVSAWNAASDWSVGRYVVMPDHLHLFCSPANTLGRPLEQWVRSWKTLASRRWPRPKQQPICQLDFWDTQLRRREHYDEKWEYVRANPVRAGLVTHPDDWPFQGELNQLPW
jgi:REP element-mobilizing transposase RayT